MKEKKGVGGDFEEGKIQNFFAGRKKWHTRTFSAGQERKEGTSEEKKLDIGNV